MKRRLMKITLCLAVYLGMTAISQAASTEAARSIADPATASRAEYGRLAQPGAVVVYSVTPSRDVSVDIEAVIPVRAQSGDFRPTVAVLRPGPPDAVPVPLSVPAGYGVQIIPADRAAPLLFDPNSIERFHRNGTATVSLPGGQTSYIVVYDPEGKTGDYVLGLASDSHYANASKADLLSQGIALKFGAAPGRELPWWDVAATLLTILGITAAGMTAAASLFPRPRSQRNLTRWHRCLTVGGFGSLAAFYAGVRILNRETGMIAVATFHDLLTVLLLLAALWLALQAPDRPAARYRWFAVLWGAGWAVQTGLLAWYFLVTRAT